MAKARPRKVRDREPPVIGRCPRCATPFHSAYAQKQHACGQERSEGDDG